MIKKIKLYYILIYILAYTINLTGLSKWIPPDSSLKYNEVTFLTSHNSYSAKRHGFIYAQQHWTIEEQLYSGVRALMLDTYTYYNNVVLCHGGILLNRILRIGQDPMSFQESLIYVKNFLEQNPNEIITIFLENYVTDCALLDSSIRSSGVDYLILKPSDWDPTINNGWPTLKWMQTKNKRLIIFNSICKTQLVFNQWQYVVENRYGVLNIKSACNERRESMAYRHCNRHLYLVNYFPSLKLNLGNSFVEINNQKLELLLEDINNGIANEKLYAGRAPNFIAIDYVNEGDAMKYVNKINYRALDRSIRKKMFDVLKAYKEPRFQP